MCIAAATLLCVAKSAQDISLVALSHYHLRQQQQNSMASSIETRTYLLELKTVHGLPVTRPVVQDACYNPDRCLIHPELTPKLPP